MTDVWHIDDVNPEGETAWFGDDDSGVSVSGSVIINLGSSDRAPGPEGAWNRVIGVVWTDDNADILQAMLTPGSERYDPDLDLNWQNNAGETLLMEVAAHGHCATVDVMLAHGADVHLVNHEGEDALQKAMSHGFGDVVLSLLKHGAKWFDDDQSLAHWAARAGSVSILDWLRTKGVDLDMQDATGMTPLVAAVKVNQPKVVFSLMEHGADATRIEFNQGENWLHWGIRNGVPEKFIRGWLEAGVDVDQVTELGQTPLSLSLLHCYPQAAELLFAHGVHVDETAKKWAKFYDCPAVKELINSHPDPSVVVQAVDVGSNPIQTASDAGGLPYWSWPLLAMGACLLRPLCKFAFSKPRSAASFRTSRSHASRGGDAGTSGTANEPRRRLTAHSNV